MTTPACPAAPRDFPAAHSGDVDWYAVDADGNVGLFCSEGAGCLPWVDAAERDAVCREVFDAADLVQRAVAGSCCTPEAPEAIAEAVLTLFAMPRHEREQYGINGKAFYERELSLTAGVKRFEKLFRESTRNARGDG